MWKTGKFFPEDDKLKNLSLTRSYTTLRSIDNFNDSFFIWSLVSTGADIVAGSRPLSYANSSDQRGDWPGQLNGPNLLAFTVIYFRPATRFKRSNWSTAALNRHKIVVLVSSSLRDPIAFASRDTWQLFFRKIYWPATRVIHAQGFETHREFVE